MTSFWKLWNASIRVNFTYECISLCVYACGVYIIFYFRAHLSGLSVSDRCLLDVFCMPNLSLQLKGPIAHKIAVLCWRCVAAALARDADHQRPLIIQHLPLPAHPTSGINYTCLALTRRWELDSHMRPDALFIITAHLLLTQSPVLKPTEKFFPLRFIWHSYPYAHHR